MPTGCNTYKTLNIAFTAPTIPPSNGYKVKWRVVGDVNWTTPPNQYSTPIQIASVPNCFNIEGTIQADCGGGNLGNPVNFAITGTPTTCYTYQLLDTANYTYVPCGSTNSVMVSNISSAPTTICALDGSVSGGSFTNFNTACID